jgi:transitional endoplasmic reticulum ATPase
MSDYHSENSESYFAGRLAKILFVSDDEKTIHIRVDNGATTRMTLEVATIFEKDDIIILNDDGIESAPNELWAKTPVTGTPLNETPQIGIVRKVLENELLIESNFVLRLVPYSGEIKVNEGNTISFYETGAISSVISDTPVHTRDIGFDGESLEPYRIDGDTGLTFEDFGGYQSVVARAKELIETQLGRQEELKAIGARPVKGVIFTGPPGTGKTLLAQIIAAEAEAKFYLVSGPTVVSKWVGDSERILRRIFEDASQQTRAIIFFDEIDSIAEHRQGDTHEASKRLVAQLLTLLDGFDRSDGNIVVIAATNRIHDVDEALLRPGRFDWEVEFGMPSFTDRLHILNVHQKTVQVSGSIPLEEIAELTEGWTPAKLSSLWTEAALVAAGDGRKAICDEDFAEAVERVAARPTRLAIRM